MRGIISAARVPALPTPRPSAIAAVAGTGGGTGTRTVASYDEDTTTLGVEAARLALAGHATVGPTTLWFSTVTPTYVDKTNATTVHAALRLPASTCGVRLRRGRALGRRRAPRRAPVGRSRRARGHRRHPHRSRQLARRGRRRRRRRRAARRRRHRRAGHRRATSGRASVTDEFLDRWRTPGDARSKQWEERFGETKYVAARPGSAWNAALKDAGVDADRGRRRCSSPAPTAGPTTASAKKLGIAGAGRRRPRPTRSATPVPPQAGAAARPPASTTAEPGQVIVLVSLADGADVLVFRTTDAIAAYRARRAPSPTRSRPATPACRTASSSPGAARSPPNPPRRPEPARPSASAAGRSTTGSSASSAPRTATTGAVHLPPARVSFEGGDIDDMEPLPDGRRARAPSSPSPSTSSPTRPSPPVVFAVVDFDGGGRLPDRALPTSTPTQVAIGDRVEMTFRAAQPPTASTTTSGRATGPGADAEREADMAATASRTASPSSGWGAPRSGSTGTRASTTCSSTRPQRGLRRRPASTKDDVDAYWFGTAQSGMSGITLARAAQLAGQAGHPRRELLRHRFRGAAPGLLRRGVGRLRHGHGASASRR